MLVTCWYSKSSDVRNPARSIRRRAFPSVPSHLGRLTCFHDPTMTLDCAVECVLVRDFIFRRGRSSRLPHNSTFLCRVECHPHSRSVANSALGLGSCMPYRNLFPLQPAYVRDTTVRTAHAFHRTQRRFLDASCVLIRHGRLHTPSLRTAGQKGSR